MKKKYELIYKEHKYEVNEGTLLSEVLIKEGLIHNMPCGGMGRCGKCVVKFKRGASAVTMADRKFLTEDELLDGYRLSCRALIKGDAELESLRRFFATSSQNRLSQEINPLSEKKNEERNESSFLIAEGFSNVDKETFLICEPLSIAVDIGTTTIAATLVNKKSIIKKISIMNSQAVYGADVISRIQADCNGKADKLQELVINDISKIIKEFLKVIEVKRLSDKNQYDKDFPIIKNIIIAGNTTMLHILMGDSCEGLGKAPYKPVRLSYPIEKLSNMPEKIKNGLYIKDFDSGDITIAVLPGISAFVGADIVSGMYSLSFEDIPLSKKYMLIDLGTNGEMAIADADSISTCSTAAGPVFEGGGISCGMAAVPGAIEHITLDCKDKKVYRINIDTIENEKPLGICGSGVLELVSELCRTKLIDETGLLIDDLFDDGIKLYSNENGKSITFSQNDIRAVQLAKAAIRSGIDSLLKAHGCKAEDIDKVFLAGGFSEHLDTEKIKYLNMFPKAFLRKGVMTCAGNTSLLGCEKMAQNAIIVGEKNTDNEKISSLSNKMKLITKRIVKKSKNIVLADTDSFSEEFIEAMNFKFNWDIIT